MEKFQQDVLTKKVLNLDVTFHWIGDSDRVWLERQTQSGDDVGRKAPRSPRRALLVLTAVALGTTGFGHAADRSVVSASDYAAAARLIPANLRGLVLNESVEPHWIGTSGRFWYRRDGESGPQFVIVTRSGTKSPAFDHARLAHALAAALGEPIAGEALPASLKEALISDDLKRFSGRIEGKSFACDLSKLQCRATDAREPEAGLLLSPDEHRAALVRDDNLYVRNLAAGEERALTTDGEQYDSWGKWPDDSLDTVARRLSGRRALPFQTYWSPDGRYLIAPRVDERKLGIAPYVEWIPQDGSRRPIVHDIRLEFPGDRDTIRTEYVLFDLVTGRRVPIPLPDGSRPGQFDGFVLGWSRSRGQAFLMTRTRGSKSAAVFRLDLATGRLAKVLEETSNTRIVTNAVEYNEANIRIIGDGAELIWYSERTGFGHLYLYDAQSGRLKNAITRGDWLVQDIQAVDEARREIYFTAGGREAGADPYFRQLYRASLDGHGGIRLLTDPAEDHQFDPNPCPTFVRQLGEAQRPSRVQPTGGVFVDTWSRVDQPPVSALRSAKDGHLIAELERADASRLFATGWSPPLRERIKAADGLTDLYAVYYAPQAKQPGKIHPIIDAAYGGPQMIVAPHNFIDAYRGGPPGGNASAYSRLGFAVVIVDGRGTPLRSRAFHDAGYTEFTQIGIDDHVAALRQLASRHPEMDLDRVGVNGWSWGGTFSAQAILSRPDFYKVAVSTAGAYDYAAMYADQLDSAIGPPIYANGTPYRDRPEASPVNWVKLDVTRLADRLTGHLMLVYGGMDENVPSVQAIRLADALTRANKPYALLYLPKRTHAVGADPYAIKRTWDYFVEYLQGATPPFDAVLAVKSAR